MTTPIQEKTAPASSGEVLLAGRWFLLRRGKRSIAVVEVRT